MKKSLLPLCSACRWPWERLKLKSSSGSDRRRHRAQVVPVAPGARYVWVPGYYRYNGHAYVWVPGRYAIPPSHYRVWVPGRWVLRNGGYVWVAGYWR